MINADSIQHKLLMVAGVQKSCYHYSILEYIIPFFLMVYTHHFKYLTPLTLLLLYISVNAAIIQHNLFRIVQVQISHNFWTILHTLYSIFAHVETSL